MQQLNALFLCLAYLVAVVSLMPGRSYDGLGVPDAEMQQGPASAVAPEETSEPSVEHPDEEGDCLGRIRHPILWEHPHPLTGRRVPHPDDAPSGFPPSVLEPPPPEC